MSSKQLVILTGAKSRPGSRCGAPLNANNIKNSKTVLKINHKKHKHSGKQRREEVPSVIESEIKGNLGISRTGKKLARARQNESPQPCLKKLKNGRIAKKNRFSPILKPRAYKTEYPSFSLDESNQTLASILELFNA